MKKIQIYFGGLNMNWPKVLLLAIITAIYTALINQVPLLKDTSFQDIAIYIDWWILFAVFIIVNCAKWWEAALKCFVFFAVSQPLIYLIEVPFVADGWGIFRYYDYWFKISLLTLPGAVIAFQLKRKNWLSVVVLSIATSYLAYASVDYFRAAMANFPNHLLSALFALGLAIFFVFGLLDKKKHRLAALSVIAAVFIVFALFTGPDKTAEIVLDEGVWNYSIDDDSVVNLEITEGNHVMLSAKRDGYTFINFESTEGRTREYYITVSGGSIYINTLEED